MAVEEMLAEVRTKLNIPDASKDLLIEDVIQDVLNFCNLAEPPAELESFIRRKVKTIIDYEADFGANTVFDAKTIREGDTSVTYNTDEVSKETIYGLSDRDKFALMKFRRMRR